ncbi:hypothetical protein PCI56_14550 [Plesiomonas shigelloides subsp. oncorhynchi]|nr:hypothetical protein [Plesiomonas shigelloides]
MLGFVNTELATAAGGRFYGLVNAFQMLGDNDDEARKMPRIVIFRAVVINPIT